MTKFWKSILSSKDPTSSKRLVTLVMALHLILASFSILFIAFYVIFYSTKGKVDKDLLGMLKDVLEYDFYIVLAGLGFTSADNIGQMLIEKAKVNKMTSEDIRLEKQIERDQPIEPEPPL
jgi:hypothetical protein